MKLSIALLLINPSAAFVATMRQHQHQQRAPLFLTPEERIKSVGAGIALVPPGGNSLFDPGQEGKLGGTQDLTLRLSRGAAYLSAVAAAAQPTGTLEAQHWLEDIGIPANFAKPTAPVAATVLGRMSLIDPDAPGDIQHVLLKLPPGFHYVEGQSLYVIPPGLTEQGKTEKPRLYSIASTRYGDLLDGSTVSLCVRRAEYYDPVTGMPDPAKAGVCSNFLCDILPDQMVQVAGPVGKTMLLPEDPSTDIIMVATGTGIAPFRSFLHRLFMETTVARHMYTGRAWLILGVPTTGGLLYDDELQAMKQNAALPNQLQIDYAISREMTNENGGKFYVQDALAQQADQLLERLQGGANIYFCGLKGMMPGILEALEDVCEEKGLNFADKLKEWQGNHQWHVEVY